MTITQSILLAFLIAGLIISLILGYFQSWFLGLKHLLRFFQSRLMLRKLERLGYFLLTPVDKLSDSKKLFLSYLKWNRDLKQLWRLDRALEFDNRSFLMEENSENDGIQMNWEKWSTVLKLIGLSFEMGENYEITADTDQQEVYVDEKKYLINRNNNSDRVTQESFIAFSEIINTALKKNGSEEQTHIYGEHPTRILILNKRLEKLFLK